MQRGKKLFDQLILKNDENKSIKKGRSEVLLNERNKLVCYRYWYYAKLHKKRYDEVLKLLSKEFFIAERSVTAIIINKSDFVKDVFKETPSLSKLKTEFYFLTWNNNN